MRSELFKIAAVAMVAALVGGGTVALADHRFDDVADGSFFHDSIGAIVDAGCATGYPDDTFRPSTNANRGQFAYWMNNCGGRAEFDRGNGVFINEPGGDAVDDLAAIDMTSGAKGDGTSLTMVTASVYVNTSGDQQSTWTLQASINGGLPFALDDAYVNVVTPETAVVNPSDSITLNAQVTQEAGDTWTFSVDGIYESGVPLANLEAEVMASSFPFEGDGTAGDVPL